MTDIKKYLTLSTDNFIYYHKTKIIILQGKILEALISENQIVVDKGENCKVVFKSDIPNFDITKFLEAGSVKYSVKNICEERTNNGVAVKSFYATGIIHYHENNQRKTISF